MLTFIAFARYKQKGDPTQKTIAPWCCFTSLRQNRADMKCFFWNSQTIFDVLWFMYEDFCIVKFISDKLSLALCTPNISLYVKRWDEIIKWFSQTSLSRIMWPEKNSCLNSLTYSLWNVTAALKKKIPFIKHFIFFLLETVCGRTGETNVWAKVCSSVVL